MGRSSRTLAVIATCLALVTFGFASSVKQVPGTKWVTAACAAQTTFFAALNSAAPNGFSEVQWRQRWWERKRWWERWWRHPTGDGGISGQPSHGRDAPLTETRRGRH